MFSPVQKLKLHKLEFSRSEGLGSLLFLEWPFVTRLAICYTELGMRLVGIDRTHVSLVIRA